MFKYLLEKENFKIEHIRIAMSNFSVQMYTLRNNHSNVKQENSGTNKYAYCHATKF